MLQVLRAQVQVQVPDPQVQVLRAQVRVPDPQVQVLRAQVRVPDPQVQVRVQVLETNCRVQPKCPDKAHCS